MQSPGLRPSRLTSPRFNRLLLACGLAIAAATLVAIMSSPSEGRTTVSWSTLRSIRPFSIVAGWFDRDDSQPFSITLDLPF